MKIFRGVEGIPKYPLVGCVPNYMIVVCFVHNYILRCRVIMQKWLDLFKFAAKTDLVLKCTTEH